MRVSLIVLLLFLFFNSCIPMQKVPKDATLTDFFHFQKANNYSPSNWAVFLPGTGGLKIFKDTTHYYEMASHLNEQGISVLLVDNVAAYKASKRSVNEEESEKILWTLEQALKWAKDKNYITSESEGSLVGWSRAGLAAIPLANDSILLDKLNIKSVVLFYPANGMGLRLKPKVPVLVLTGGKDKIVKVEDILDKMVADNVTIKVYDNAYHGFDVASQEEGKYFRIIPFIGKKKYLLKYNELAANESIKELIEFLGKSE